MVPALRITATCKASRAERPYTEPMSALAARISDMPGQNVVGNRVKALERSVNGIKPLNRRVAMKYLLVDLHIGDESFPVSHQLG